MNRPAMAVTLSLTLLMLLTGGDEPHRPVREGRAVPLVSSIDTPAVGRHVILGCTPTEPSECTALLSAMREGMLGGICLFPEETDRLDPDHGRIRRFIAALREASPHPIIVAIDQEGGCVSRLGPADGAAGNWTARSLGRKDDPEQTWEQAWMTATMLADVGIDLNLAPVVDLDANPVSPAIGAQGRSYSADPDVVVRHAGLMLRAQHDAGLLSAVKHFPGHGSATTDSHLSLPDITSTWSDAELTPYRRLIPGGLCDVVMTGHLIHQELGGTTPSSLSPPVIRGLLRGQLGFSGVVISDDLEMLPVRQAVPLRDRVCKPIWAGTDLLLFCHPRDGNAHFIRTVNTILIDEVSRNRRMRKHCRESMLRIDHLLTTLRARRASEETETTHTFTL